MSAEGIVGTENANTARRRTAGSQKRRSKLSGGGTRAEDFPSAKEASRSDFVIEAIPLGLPALCAKVTYNSGTKVAYLELRTMEQASLIQFLESKSPIWTSSSHIVRFSCPRHNKCATRRDPGEISGLLGVVLANLTTPTGCRVINFSDAAPTLLSRPEILQSQSVCYPAGTASTQIRRSIWLNTPLCGCPSANNRQ